MLSEEQFKAGRYDAALEVFRTLENTGARSAGNSHHDRPVLRENGSKRRPSIKVDATNKFPESTALQIELGDIHLSKQDYELPVQRTKQLLRSTPSMTAYLKLGELLVKEAKVDDALKYLEVSLKKNPKGALMHYGLANLKKQIASMSGELKILGEAETAYRAALS